MVRDVDAPSEVIWSRILDFEAYPRMIKGCDDCRVYATEQTAEPPVDLDRDEKRFLCSFTVDGQRRLLVTVSDQLNDRELLREHPVVRL